MCVVFDRAYTDALPEVREYLKTRAGVGDVSDRELIIVVQAFTTPGYAKVHPGIRDYNRLEFLGDAIIKAYVSRNIFDRFPELDEGRMSKICQNLWNDKTYPSCILDSGFDFIGLLLLPGSVQNQDIGRKVDYLASVVSDSFEAFVGALEIIGRQDEWKSVIDKVLLFGID